MSEFEEDGSFDGSSTLSKINSAHIVNITLNELWKDYFRHYKGQKYKEANMDLDCIWTILGGEKGIAGTEKEKEYLKIEQDIASNGNMPNGFSRLILSKKPDATFVSLVRKQVLNLQKKALFLRRLQNEQGKGSAYHDADEDYMDG